MQPPSGVQTLQVPWRHSLDAHAFPHLPQLAALVSRSTQRVPHVLDANSGHLPPSATRCTSVERHDASAAISAAIEADFAAATPARSRDRRRVAIILE
jgi:hypothetical protein